MSVLSARDGHDGDVLAVVSQSGPTVTFFDAATHVALADLELPGGEPHELCFDPTQRLLWCTHAYESGYYHANAGQLSRVTVIDPDARRIVDVSVEGSDARSRGVVMIDTVTRNILGRIDNRNPRPALVRHRSHR